MLIHFPGEKSGTRDYWLPKDSGNAPVEHLSAIVEEGGLLEELLDSNINCVYVEASQDRYREGISMLARTFYSCRGGISNKQVHKGWSEEGHLRAPMCCGKNTVGNEVSRSRCEPPG